MRKEEYRQININVTKSFFDDFFSTTKKVSSILFTLMISFINWYQFSFIYYYFLDMNGTILP